MCSSFVVRVRRVYSRMAVSVTKHPYSGRLSDSSQPQSRQSSQKPSCSRRSVCALSKKAASAADEVISAIRPGPMQYRTSSQSISVDDELQGQDGCMGPLGSLAVVTVSVPAVTGRGGRMSGGRVVVEWSPRVLVGCWSGEGRWRNWICRPGLRASPHC